MDNGALPTCGIAVMAKASIAGRTKTRLVPPLTSEEAARCNTAFLLDIADNILAASAQASIAGYIAFGPPHSRPFFEANLPSEVGLIDAWYANFGDCLSCTIERLLERRHLGAVVLNSDSPTLPTSLLLKTAELLARPALDHDARSSGQRGALALAKDVRLRGLETGFQSKRLVHRCDERRARSERAALGQPSERKPIENSVAPDRRGPFWLVVCRRQDSNVGDYSEISMIYVFAVLF